MPDSTGPDDADRLPGRDGTDDPFGDAPDAWAEADRAYEARWSDDPDALSAGAEASDASGWSESPRTDRPVVSTRATTTGVADSYLDGMQAAGPYLGLGVQIAASMAVFAGGGYAIDRWLGSTPWGLLVGAALGMAGIVALLVRVSREADAQRAARKAKK